MNLLASGLLLGLGTMQLISAHEALKDGNMKFGVIYVMLGLACYIIALI